MTVKNRKQSLAAAAVMLCICASATQADIIIDVQDTVITADGTGFVDVLISTTGGDNVDFASYVFGLSAVGSPGSTLEFIGVEGHADPNYIFAGDPSVDGISLDDLSPVQLTASDLTDSSSPPGTGTDRLLARLLLNHDLVLGETAGDAIANDSFRITLIDDSLGLGNTFFSDDVRGEPFIDASSFDPFVGGGLITVTAASAAVPEPGTFAVTGLLLLGSWYFRKRTSGNAVLQPEAST